MIKRVKTGIKGFDDLVMGGFPENSSILVCGTPGTGKTIFGLEFIYNGAKKYKEKGLYVTFEQSEEALYQQAELFGWKMRKMKNLDILNIPIEEIDDKKVNNILEKVKKEKYKRIVIDSLSTLAINAPIYSKIVDISLKDVMAKKSFFSPPIIGDFVVKRFIYTFLDKLRDIKCTSLLISEASEKGEFISRDTISEFAADGILQITFESMGGEFSRSLIVRKMRHTKNDEDIHPLEINNKKGVIIHSLEEKT